MSQTLFITANPRTKDKSTSLSLGDGFLLTYREAKPEDEIVVIDLYNSDIPEIDYDLMSVIEQIKMGKSPENLTRQKRLSKKPLPKFPHLSSGLHRTKAEKNGKHKHQNPKTNLKVK